MTTPPHDPVGTPGRTNTGDAGNTTGAVGVTRHRRSGNRTRRGPGVPGVLWVPATAALALVVLPVAGLVTRTDLTRLPGLLTQPAALNALRLSLVTATLSTGACVLLGVPLAVVLARARGRVVRLLRAVVLLPLVLPPVVGGLALLFLFGRTGFLGELLDAVAGVRVPFTTAAVVLAQTFVAMPFLVVSLEGALRASGTAHERVAATLGAGPGTVLRRVTLPLLWPALGSGAVLSFARALGEFGATLTFAGSLEGVTRTLPVEVYHQSQTDVDSAVAVALLLVVVAVVVIVAARPGGVEGMRP